MTMQDFSRPSTSQRLENSHPPAWRPFTRYGLVMAAALLLSLPTSAGTTATAAQEVSPIRSYVSRESDHQGLTSVIWPPREVPFSLRASSDTGPATFELVFSGLTTSSAELVLGSADAVNIVFDVELRRVLLWDVSRNGLLETRAPSTSLRGRGVPHISFVAAAQLGLERVNGLALDRAGRVLYLLDGATARIVTVELARDGELRSTEKRLGQLVLDDERLFDLKGLAVHPSTGHLYALSRSASTLYAIDVDGAFLSAYRLVDVDSQLPTRMIFAPSADLTDDPDRTHLYIASGGLNDSISEWSLETTRQRIAEASHMTDPSRLVQTIDTSLFSPPSPDAAGLAYIAHTDTLLESDSEVNEMTIFEGVNLWEMTTLGAPVDTLTTTAFSNEPTGVAYNPSDTHLFFSDDDLREVFELDPGPDGLYGTADDVVTSFDTLVFDCNDPEGITFDTWAGALFIVDGINAEVYRVDPGVNGIFDGVPPTGDDVVASFDTEAHGVRDPEGITFDTDNGYLYILGDPDTQVAQFATDGQFMRMIDTSAVNPLSGAGLAFAPSSEDPAVMNLWITDRGVDNDSDPTENDGKIYELTIPPQSGSCGNLICDVGEDCNTCAIDCISGGAACGNGICEAGDGEDCVSCASDCRGKQNGKPSRRYCCGDGDGEAPVSCSDSRCTQGKWQCTDTPAAMYCCGDTVCEGIEDSFNCAVDCGSPPQCGDTICVPPSETVCSCSDDCGSPPTSESGFVETVSTTTVTLSSTATTMIALPIRGVRAHRKVIRVRPIAIAAAAAARASRNRRAASECRGLNPSWRPPGGGYTRSARVWESSEEPTSIGDAVSCSRGLSSVRRSRMRVEVTGWTSGRSRHICPILTEA